MLMTGYDNVPKCLIEPTDVMLYYYHIVHKKINITATILHARAKNDVPLS